MIDPAEPWERSASPLLVRLARIADAEGLTHTQLVRVIWKRVVKTGLVS